MWFLNSSFTWFLCRQMTWPSPIWCPNLSFGFPEFQLRTTACKTAAAVFLRRWTVTPRLSTDTGYPSARCDLLPSRTVRTPCPTGTAPCPGFEQPRNVRQPRSDLQLKFRRKNLFSIVRLCNNNILKRLKVKIWTRPLIWPRILSPSFQKVLTSVTR